MAPTSSPSQEITAAGPLLSSVLATADATVASNDAPPRADEPTFDRGQSIGRYLLLDLLGQGAMGRVFRAYDPDLDRPVALKLLHGDIRQAPEHRDRLLDEAKAMARIDHPNVVTVHDAGVHEGSVFIAMEIVDGPSLDRWLKMPHSPAEILDALTGAARGLAAAHAAGVVHRDFKPANVLVTDDGRAKVGDFGLAGIEDTTRPSEATAASGHAIGTPAYMSPEHLAGAGIDARSDQFSFAITLYEALHGVRPFSGTTWPELAGQITTGEIIPALAARRRGLDGLVRRALAIDPSDRFASMDELITAIDRIRTPAWRRFAGLGTAALVIGALVLGRGDERDACEPGARRVETFWGPSVTTSLRVGGRDYAPELSARSRIVLEQALDDYTAQWITAYDASCPTVGPQAQQGTLGQQATAQCLENRLESLQGLTELVTHELIDATRVTELVGTLPDLDDCTSGDWVPYPADPAKAAVAAELHRTIARVRRARIADRREEVMDQAQGMVTRARELGEPYLLAWALSEQARLLEGTAGVDALLTEALEVAIAGGFELRAAYIVNDVLLTIPNERKGASQHEIGPLAAMARGLVERAGGDEDLLGNLALNEASIMRSAERFDQAIALDRRAEEHFSRMGSHEGVAKARLNQAVTRIKQGSIDAAIPQLTEAVAALERESDTSSPLAFQGRTILISALTHAGRTAEAHAMAARAYQDARKLYAPESHTLRWAMTAHAYTALNVGDVPVGNELLDSLRALPNSLDQTAELEVIALGLLQLQGRHEEVLRAMPSLRTRFAAASPFHRFWLEAAFGASSFLMGNRELAHEILAKQWARTDRANEEEAEPNMRSALLLLAMVSDAPLPPGTRWQDLQPDDPRLNLLDRRLVEAFSGNEDPLPAVRRTRKELASSYPPQDVSMQLLDAWLAAQEPTSPPSRRLTAP